MIENDVPDAKMTNKPLPPITAAIPAFPSVGNPENTVSIGGKLIEIKPTKLKYIRSLERDLAYRHQIKQAVTDTKAEQDRLSKSQQASDQIVQQIAKTLVLLEATFDHSFGSRIHDSWLSLRDISAASSVLCHYFHRN